MTKIIPIKYSPLRVLFERDEETLTTQMKELKEEIKIDCPYDLDKTIVDEIGFWCSYIEFGPDDFTRYRLLPVYKRSLNE